MFRVPPLAALHPSTITYEKSLPNVWINPAFKPTNRVKRKHNFLGGAQGEGQTWMALGLIGERLLQSLRELFTSAALWFYYSALCSTCSPGDFTWCICSWFQIMKSHHQHDEGVVAATGSHALYSVGSEFGRLQSKPHRTLLSIFLFDSVMNELCSSPGSRTICWAPLCACKGHSCKSRSVFFHILYYDLF